MPRFNFSRKTILDAAIWALGAIGRADYVVGGMAIAAQNQLKLDKRRIKETQQSRQLVEETESYVESLEPVLVNDNHPLQLEAVDVRKPIRSNADGGTYPQLFLEREFPYPSLGSN